jgi:hypothetical protein
MPLTVIDRYHLPFKDLQLIKMPGLSAQAIECFDMLQVVFGAQLQSSESKLLGILSWFTAICVYVKWARFWDTLTWTKNIFTLDGHTKQFPTSYALIKE